jgi:hypothetical protein
VHSPGQPATSQTSVYRMKPTLYVAVNTSQECDKDSLGNIKEQYKIVNGKAPIFVQSVTRYYLEYSKSGTHYPNMCACAGLPFSVCLRYSKAERICSILGRKQF